MITLIIGDVGEYLTQYAIKIDPDAKLITEQNLSDLTNGTYYTSLGDLGNLRNLGIAFQKSHRIIYVPPPENRWSDQNRSGNSMQKKWTEDYLDIFSYRTLVENFDRVIRTDSDELLKLADQRQIDQSQLWIVGDSISHGVGVSKSERYGRILSDKLNLPVSFLTAPGSSLIWAADQILRSDIRENDTVVWGLTSNFRFPYFSTEKLNHVNITFYKNNPTFDKSIPIVNLTSQDLLYRSVISVHQVINFCKKIGVRLIIASLMDNDVYHYISDSSSLIMLSNMWGRNAGDLYEDLGSDNDHPGPKTHRFYAEEIYRKLVSS